MRCFRWACTSLFLIAPAHADQPMPKRVGQCAISTLTSIEAVYGGKSHQPKSPNDDNGIMFGEKNDISGHSMSYVAAVGESRVGDKVRSCLVSIPEGCPKDDDRGKVWKTTNLRTHKTWVMMDALHGCGGA